ncbi:hypothetical protein Q3G72_010421 [Acer saccharum]|nr:hypothetical protein Q3G72_010421 [Acer saccharum]
MAEALALLRGIRFAHDSGEAPLSDVGLIISNIHDLLASVPSFNVVFVSRSTNMAAHGMAKFGLFIATYSFWMEKVPPSVAPIVFGEYPILL